MKLQRIVKPGKKVKLPLSLPESDLDVLRQYAKFYKITYGEEIKDTELAVHIITDYLKTDEDFVTYLSDVTKSTRPEVNKSTRKVA